MVVLYPKDTEKWKQFTTNTVGEDITFSLFCIPKILKNESNSQQRWIYSEHSPCCFVSQRYWKMKAIHNETLNFNLSTDVVLYPKDTEKWKQFTTTLHFHAIVKQLFCIPKILKNESNSQLQNLTVKFLICCFVSQRYWKMKAIHNGGDGFADFLFVVLYPKDTEKWKQFTTFWNNGVNRKRLFCIPKILKNESNSQQKVCTPFFRVSCFVSQRYWKMKAIHNGASNRS